MSGWKARIGYLSPSVFETPSDWDLILPKGFTIVASGLNVQAHTTEEFDKAINALEKGLGIFNAEECDAILMGGITLGTQRGYQVERQVVAGVLTIAPVPRPDVNRTARPQPRRCFQRGYR